MPADREHAHHLVDQLPPDQLAALIRLLETIVSHDDNDVLGAGERRAVAEADEWLKHNHPIPNEEVLGDFGLTTDDWERMGQEEEPRRSG